MTLIPVSRTSGAPGLFVQRRRLAMDRQARDLGCERRPAVDRIPGDVDHAAEQRLAHGNGDWSTRIAHGHSAGQARRVAHGDTAHRARIEMEMDLEHDGPPTIGGDLQSLVDGGERRLGDFHVDDGADDARNHAGNRRCLKIFAASLHQG